MAKNVRTFLDGDSPSDMDLKPKHLTKQEFGRKLYMLMKSKGWNQSELSRQAGIARDSVSTYVRGITFPEGENLKRLANAFGIDTTELLPNHVEAAIDQDIPSLELKISTFNTNIAWLRVNRLVSTTTAMKVLDMLNQDVLPERKETV